MALSTAERTRVLALIETKETELAAARTTYLSLLGKEVKEYRLNTGEGSQWATRIDINTLGKQISALEREIDRLYGRLNGTNLMNIVLRRQ